MKRAKKVNLVLIAVTLVAATVYIVSNILAGFHNFTSFPWWSAFAFAGIYFGPVLLLETVVYGILVIIEKT